MRFVARFLLVVLPVLCAALPVAAEDGPSVGDHLLVTTADAPLRSCNDTTGHFPAGADLAIKHINGDWFWVAYMHGTETERGWIHRADVVERSRALEQLNDRLQTNPTAATYAVRGKLRCDHGGLEIALADCNQALCLDRSTRLAYDTRASVWMKQGDFDRALADWNEALRLDPQDVHALDGRGAAWAAKAEVDFEAAAKIKKPSAVVTASASDVSAQSVSSGNPLSPPVLLEMSHPAGNLTLNNVAFCVTITNYGNWDRFKKDVFAPDQLILLYTEVENFSSELRTDQIWHAVMKSTITIRDARGELVKEMAFPRNDDMCHTVRRDYYNSYEFSIPEKCTPGPHMLTLKVEDLLSGKTASQSVDFLVK
jgi:hypothetical protein